MGTETRYLIGPGAKLWKTEVSISSDINGSAVCTGEIKKNISYLLLLNKRYLAYINWPTISNLRLILKTFTCIFVIRNLTREMSVCPAVHRARSRAHNTKARA